jgi:murE/murF fusion protein
MISPVADRLHPLMVRDEAAERLAESLLASLPNGQLVDEVAAAGQGDWLCLCPGRTTGFDALLRMAHDRGLTHLVIDAADQAYLDQWRRSTPDWQPVVRTLSDLAKRRGVLAHAFYGYPTDAMTVVAVTGTNGKSSVAHGLARCLADAYGQAASIGTLGVCLHQCKSGVVQGLQQDGPLLTSLPAVRLARSLAMLRKQGVTHVVMEASSIGLDQYRLAGCQIHIAALTNLTQDHLDYHGSFEAYAQAKLRLFQSPMLKSVVLVEPGPAALGQARWLFEQACAQTHALQQLVVSVSVDGQVQVNGQATSVVMSPSGLGRHNLENLAVVAGCLEALGLPALTQPERLAAFALPKGRLELIVPSPDVSVQDELPLVYVDYAHTPDALAQVLQALRAKAQDRGGQLRLVFGCGGDRDRGKRALMGAVAAAHADFTWITSDNPRSEDPMAIAGEILQGMPGCLNQRVVLGRDLAIGQAIGTARTQDVILIAGKGHEAGQTIAGQTLPFQDQDEARQALSGWRANPGLDRLVDGLKAQGLLVGLTLASSAQSLTEARAIQFCTDSRQLQAGDVFIALSGEHFDGHRFCEAAVRAGASALVVSQPVDLSEDCAGTPVIQVTDGLAALTQMARTWREAWSGELVAVVGSNGKTTVKEMMAAVLRACHGRQHVHATPGNLNNQIGVPLSLLGLQGRHRSAVIELGMNHPGEIQGLAQLAQPHLVLMTNAQREHQAFMKTVEACARENGQALTCLAPGGMAVLPMDSNHLPIWLAQLNPSIQSILFGHTSESTVAEPGRMTVCFESSRSDQAVTEFVTTQGQTARRQTAVLQGIGDHFARNAAAVMAATLALGLDADAALRALAGFQPMPGRGRIYRGSDFQLVDDSYNANPDSVCAAIVGLAQQPPPRAIVLGDMGEVGELSDAFHNEVVQRAFDAGLERICLHGQAMAAAAQRSGVGEVFESVDLLTDSLQSWVDQKTKEGLHPTIWVKGSRFMKMERVSQALQNWMTGHAARAH